MLASKNNEFCVDSGLVVDDGDLSGETLIVES